MARHRIGLYWFELWRRDLPQLVGQQITSHTKPGADGVGQQAIGRWGKPIEAELVAWIWGSANPLSNLLLAKLMVPRYQALRGAGPQNVRYNDIDFTARFNTRWSVDDVVELDCRAKVRLVTNLLDYPNGVELIMLFRMTPHLIA